MASPVDKTLSESFNEFTLDIYKNLANKNSENLFMSPSSIMVVMTMVHAGARGNTESQMRKTLRLEKLEQSGIHSAIEAFVRLLKKDSSDFTLTLANKLYPHADKTILDSYVNTVTKHFLAETKSLDYTTNPDGCRHEINRWVQEETKSKIKDLLAPGTITPLTALVVVNAIYFNGDWANKFDTEKTTKRRFYVTATKRVIVDMMFKHFKKIKYGRIDSLDCSVLELPYKGGELSMLILLPNKLDGLSSLEKNLSAGQLMNISSSIYPGNVYVYLPKFKLESTFKLNDCLAELGMPDVFNEEKANFSGMSEMELYVSHVIHKAYVDVNEEGTEATASTAAVIKVKGLPNVHSFEADHPFLFLIQDNRSGVPLFIGRLVAPPGDEIVPRQRKRKQQDE